MNSSPAFQLYLTEQPMPHFGNFRGGGKTLFAGEMLVRKIALFAGRLCRENFSRISLIEWLR